MKHESIHIEQDWESFLDGLVRYYSPEHERKVKTLIRIILSREKTRLVREMRRAMLPGELDNRAIHTFNKGIKRGIFFVQRD